MFVNISNHPSSVWGESQMSSAEAWGDVVDYAFPTVSPSLDMYGLSELADKVVEEVCHLVSNDVSGSALHIMGEMTLTFMLVSRFRAKGYHCLASTTARTCEIHDDGTKISKFEFVQFRDYSD